MTSNNPAQPHPPEVARYLKGAGPEARQFDFLLGEWEVEGTRYGEDGTAVLNYQALWSARSWNDGRMVMDDFRTLAPNGDPISSFVTLRTYSEVTGRWEMAGLQALQPSLPMEWHGISNDGEMLLDAIAHLPNGQRVHSRIRFFDIEAASFAWENSMSFDQGATWRKT